jgi:hypothetical protein
MSGTLPEDKVRRFLQATPEQQQLIDRILAGHDTKQASAEYAVINEMLTKEKLAPKLHVGIRTIENWQRRGVLPYVKIGKVVIFIWGDVVEALKKFRICRKTCK